MWITTYPFGTLHLDKFNKLGKFSHIPPKKDIKIGNDVWIAQDVRITGGVTIGDGAIIANNSHVVKDVEPYTIVGGNPARYIKHRFYKDVIEKLLEIQWWNWEDEKINEILPILCSADSRKILEL